MVETRSMSKSHKIVIDERKNIKITGVNKVISVEPELILLLTELGRLKITGKDMHITTLDIDKGMVDITGIVNCMCYTTDKDGGISLKRLFK
jgi:sporulation protein YabP